MARRLVRQMTEHERDMEQRNRAIKQDIIQKLESHSQASGTIMQNQEELKNSLKSHSDLLMQVKQEISKLMKEQLEMRRSQKRLQEIWILNFLFVIVPLLAVWVVLLVYWVVM